MKLKNKTELIIGILGGLIIPFSALYIFYLIKFNQLSFFEFTNRIIKLNIAGKIFSLAAIPNLLLFFLFIWSNKMNGAKGVIGATFIITLAILIMKLLS